MSPIEQYTIDCEDGFFMFFGGQKINYQIDIMQLFSANPTTFSPENMKKPSANRAKFAINCVLLYWRHLPGRLLYNDFLKHSYLLTAVPLILSGFTKDVTTITL